MSLLLLLFFDFGYKKAAETFYASTTLTVSDKFFLPYDGQSFYLIAFYYISEIVLRNAAKPHRAIAAVHIVYLIIHAGIAHI